MEACNVCGIKFAQSPLITSTVFPRFDISDGVGGLNWDATPFKPYVVNSDNTGVRAREFVSQGTLIPTLGLALLVEKETQFMKNNHNWQQHAATLVLKDTDGSDIKQWICGSPKLYAREHVGMFGASLTMLINEPREEDKHYGFQPNCAFVAGHVVTLRTIQKNEPLTVCYNYSEVASNKDVPPSYEAVDTLDDHPLIAVGATTIRRSEFVAKAEAFILQDAKFRRIVQTYLDVVCVWAATATRFLNAQSIGNIRYKLTLRDKNKYPWIPILNGNVNPSVFIKRVKDNLVLCDTLLLFENDGVTLDVMSASCISQDDAKRYFTSLDAFLKMCKIVYSAEVATKTINDVQSLLNTRTPSPKNVLIIARCLSDAVFLKNELTNDYSGQYARAYLEIDLEHVHRIIAEAHSPKNTQEELKKVTIPASGKTKVIGQKLVGLVNLGNTCFMNASLQCVFAAVNFFPLSNEFANNITPEYIEVGKSFMSLYDNPTEFNLEIFHAACSQNTEYLKFFCDGSFEQHDAQEFTSALLNVLEKTFSRFEFPLKADASYSKEYTIPNGITKLNFAVDQFLQDVKKKTEDSIISDNFLSVHGAIKYCGCPRSIKYETEKMLKLRFPDFYAKEVQIQDLVKFYKKKELVEDRKCGTCKNKMQRKLKILTWPNILVLHFVRNAFDRKPLKIKTKVNIEETRKFDGNPYNLFAVVNTLGDSPNSGHYTAFIKNDDSWYYANDSHITAATADNLNDKNENVYMLFYKKT